MGRLCLLTLCIAASSFGQDYFPLHVGNQWVYQQQGGALALNPVVVEIAEAKVVDGRVFSLLRGLPEGELWLTQDADGVLYSMDPVTMREAVWARFRTAEGGTYTSGISACNSTAKVDSRNATVKVPAGEWGGALAISYPNPSCADAGLESEVFLPWIGLMKRTSTTIAGPVSLELIYARVGGVTVLAQPEVSFAVTLDKAIYRPGEMITARLTLRATQGAPLTLNFSSGQRFDFSIKNRAGESAYTWSADKLFPQVTGTESVRGERNWVLRAPAPQAVGSYSAEGWLATAAGQSYRGTVSFAVASN
ncbi:MAG: BsuPI-related putative proteinase inhibitor [Bryobacteraceae bacterium]